MDQPTLNLSLNASQATELKTLLTKTLPSLFNPEKSEIIQSILDAFKINSPVLKTVESIEEISYTSFCFSCRCETNTVKVNHEPYCQVCDFIK
jgi:hypothetical protein